MPAQWSFVLTDAQGNALAELSTASGRTIALKRNSYTEVNFTISHEDDAATLLLAALAAGVPKLKGYRRGTYDTVTTPATLRFRGPLAAVSEQSDETSLLTATFRSPFCVLAGDGDTAGRFLTSQFSTVYALTDAGLIAKGLIDTANADSATGLATSAALIAATTTRNATYPTGQSIGAAITNLSALLNGFDFYETYVDGIGATDANFNIVAAQGITNPTARFEYGPSTLSNVSSVNRTTTPPLNTIFVTGGNSLTSTYSDTTSVAKYGKWWGHYDFSDVIDQPTLDAKARALCRPNPVKTISIVPELGLDSCPKPFDDWNLGDTVPFYASRVALIENAQMRINGFTIPIDDNGYEAVTVDDPTSPEDDAVAMAQLDAEIDVTS